MVWGNLVVPVSLRESLASFRVITYECFSHFPEDLRVLWSQKFALRASAGILRRFAGRWPFGDRVLAGQEDRSGADDAPP